MVSNDEISRKLWEKREGQVSGRYLVCNSCEGYYKLQPGETSRDFNLDCECGGRLINSPSKTLFNNSFYEKRDYGSEIFICYALLLFGGLLAIAGGFYLLTRDNERANFHGKIILGISLFFVLLPLILFFILSG